MTIPDPMNPMPRPPLDDPDELRRSRYMRSRAPSKWWAVGVWGGLIVALLALTFL